MAGERVGCRRAVAKSRSGADWRRATRAARQGTPEQNPDRTRLRVPYRAGLG